MARQKVTKTVRATYFTWKLFKRGTVYYADGRSNATDLGKYSLKTVSEEEALLNLQRLDKFKAKQAGLVPEEVASPKAVDRKEPVGVEEGWNKFLEHIENAVVTGLRSRNTLTRYREIRAKHLVYCNLHSIRNWCDFDQDHGERYVRWLVEQGAATRSRNLAMTTILSTMKWLIKRQLLDAKSRIHVTLPKPTGTDTYCYTRKEMARILEFCLTSKAGLWIRPLLITLATTGMRIGEVSLLRWSDIDFDSDVIRIKDERSSRRREIKGRVRTTKGKRSRTVPLNKALKDVLSQMERHPDGFVFHGAKGAMVKVKRVLPLFKRAIRDRLKHEFPVTEGDIGFQHGTIHSFRHYFVSEAFRMNFTETEIMDWVGHRDSEMVHHYRHQRPGESQRRMQSSNFISDDIGSSEA